MTFQVTILGSNSAVPAYGRHHTAQHIQYNNLRFLVDCGEATQNQLKTFKISALKINAIFISHLHGDHYLGLPGLLASMHLQGRTKALDLYAPSGLLHILIAHFKYSDTTLKYELRFHKTDGTTNDVLFENKKLTISTIPLKHRIECKGFLFKEKPHELRLNKDTLPEDLTLAQIGSLKKGDDVLSEDGKILYKNNKLTLPPLPQKSYAYCSDTAYIPELSKQLYKVGMLYHEATFLDENELRASNTFHATASQAATLAKKANIKTLLLGHFSARYKDLKPIEDEARKIFKNSHLALEGKTFVVD